MFEEITSKLGNKYQTEADLKLSLLTIQVQLLR